MKRTSAWILGILMFFLTVCSGCTQGTASLAFDGTMEYADGLGCYFNRARDHVFIGTIPWLSREETVTIPDTIDGAKVFSIGGYYGTGGPVQCSPKLSGASEWRKCYLSGDPDPTVYQKRSSVIRMHLGANVTGPILLDSGYFQPVGTVSGPIPLVTIGYYLTVDEKNPVFYAKDGHLYLKEDDTPYSVVGVYWDELEE